MDFVLTTGTAATAAMLLVAMVKAAWPAVPSFAVVLSAFLSGEVMSFLVTVGQGKPLEGAELATTIIAGIFAAATAAGVRSADNKADERRGAAQGGG